jgi:cytoskeletal protein RodZ
VDDANTPPQDDAPPGEEPLGEDRPTAAASSHRDAQASEEAVAPARTIGEALRRAREAAGLTLAQVADRTKVRPGILSEIEADDHEKLPALTYSLGFVKAYARTVGLDPAGAAERYRLESQKGDPVPTMVDLMPLEEKRLPSPALVAGSVAILLLVLGGFWAWGAGWLTPAAPPVPETPVAIEAAGPDAPDPEAPPAASAQAADPNAAVTLTAKEEVWLRISDREETLFMGTMSKGQTMTLPPGRDWTLRTGRAGALDVKVGTVAIAPLGDPAEQVRNLSLKPEDLLARQAPAAG